MFNSEKRKKNTEKQRKFRKKHLKDECDRIRLQCNFQTGSKKNLERLALYNGHTETNMLEILIAEKTHELLQKLSTEEIALFYDGKLKRNQEPEQC